MARSEPNDKIEVEEQSADVVRCLAYRDQLETSWEEIQKQPVKKILQSFPGTLLEDKGTSAIIDVWDRQWVSMRFERTSPEQAQIFLFSIRILSQHVDPLLALSGNKGLYFEPRSQCGRSPNESYHVTWLHQVTFQDAKYSQQTAPQQATLVRHGERYGLRSDTMNAQEIHQKFRPGLPMLLGNAKTMYSVGPLPYATTREGVAKLLKAWRWDARPLQPRGRAPDDTGVTWSVQAVEEPSHWVYTLKHGDVLVTKLQPTKKPPVQSAPYNFVASRKTLDHLQQQATDPWLTSDPWMRTPEKASQSGVKMATPNAPVLTVGQITALEQSIEKKVLQAIQTKQEDEPMETSPLEARVFALENQLHNVQQSQTSIDGRLGQMQNQLDQQTKAFSTVMEQRMQEQMDRIETLMSKRVRLDH